MSFNENLETGTRDLRRPLLHKGSWYNNSSKNVIERGQSSQTVPEAPKESAVIVVFCTLIVALGPLQYGFTVSCSCPLSFLNQ